MTKGAPASRNSSQELCNRSYCVAAPPASLWHSPGRPSITQGPSRRCSFLHTEGQSELRSVPCGPWRRWTRSRPSCLASTQSIPVLVCSSAVPARDAQARTFQAYGVHVLPGRPSLRRLLGRVRRLLTRRSAVLTISGSGGTGSLWPRQVGGRTRPGVTAAMRAGRRELG
jgi:hypothetical protein